MKYVKYFSYLFRHKWFVFLACCKYGLYWQGIIHDWSKFLPDEFIPYMEHFYGKYKREWRDKTGYYNPVNTGDVEFDYAWLRHQNRNPHHWQYWVLSEDGGATFPLKIPDKYLKEMLCDWTGAGRAQKSTGVLDWYTKNRNKMVIHVDSRAWIEREIKYVPTSD